MTKTVLKATLTCILISVTAAVIFSATASASIAWGGITQEQHSFPTAISMSSEIDTAWRHTREGWQNSANWAAPNSFVPQKTVELVHPLAWAGIVLLGVIGTMIWASSEWEISRLFTED